MKGSEEEVITVRYDKINGMTIDQITKSDELINEVMEKSVHCNSLSGTEYAECIADNVKESVNKLSESKSRITKYRYLMSSRLRNYTCADESLNTSTPLSSKMTFILNKHYRVNSLFDTSHAKIWAIDDFISDEECAILEKYGGPRLQRATVAAEDGTSTVSNHRKAQQAGYEMLSRPNDPMWYAHITFTNRLSRKYTYTNSYTSILSRVLSD